MAERAAGGQAGYPPQKRRGFAQIGERHMTEVERRKRVQALTERFAPQAESAAPELFQHIYSTSPDFGNMGSKEKHKTVSQAISAYSKMTDPDEIEAFTGALLKAGGEEETYSIAEGAWDIAVPSAGAVGGFFAGGPVGEVVGGASAAAIGETLKAMYERHQRGIEPMSVSEMAENGVPVGIAQLLFGAGAPVLSRLRLMATKKALLPKGGLSPGMARTHEILGEMPLKEGESGIFRKVVERLRWGPKGARAGLLPGQMNMPEQNLVASLYELFSGAFVTSGISARRTEVAAGAGQKYARRMLSDIIEFVEPKKVGRLARDAIEGKLKIAKVAQEANWQYARRAVSEWDGKVSMNELYTWLREATAIKARGKDVEEITKIVKGVTGTSKQTPIPEVFGAVDTFDLWRALNSAGGDKDFQKVAGHVARRVRDDLFNQAKDAAPSVYKELTAARDFHGWVKDTFETRFMRDFIEDLAETGKPEAIVETVLGGSHAKVAANLRRIEGASSPRAFDQKVLPPLRYHFMRGVEYYDKELGTDIISGQLMLNKLKQYGVVIDPKKSGKVLNGGEYLESLWGGRQGVQNLHDMAVAVDLSNLSPSGGKLVMKMAEAGVAMGALQRKIPAKELSQSAAIVLMTPMLAFTGVLANRRLAREMTDGVLGHKPIEYAIATAVRLHTEAANKITPENARNLLEYAKRANEEMDMNRGETKEGNIMLEGGGN